MIMKRHLMYIQLLTVTSPHEDLEKLPVIVIVDNGTNKYVKQGMRELTQVILDISPCLGSDASEFIPVVVEVWDGTESNPSTARRSRGKA